MKKKSKKIISKPHGVKELYENYPGFVVAVIASIIIIIVFAFMLINPITPNTKSALADEYSIQNKEAISFNITELSKELEKELESTLDDDSLFSIRSDFEWLQKKEIEYYSKHPLSEVEEREVAIFLFIDTIFEINDGSQLQIGEPDYQATIKRGLQDLNTPVITPKDLEFLEIDSDLGLVSFYFNELFAEYVIQKRIIIQSSDSTERKFVEAKKLIYINYLTFE